MKKRNRLRKILLMCVLLGALASCSPDVPAADGIGDTSVPEETTAPAPKTVGGQFGFKQAFTWEYDPSSQTMTVSGEGALPDLTPGKQKWADYSGEIQTVILAEGITEIEARAFENMENLAGITIPDSVTSIESDAFKDCPNLTIHRIPVGTTDLLDGCKPIMDQLSGIMNLLNNHKTGDQAGASEIIRRLKGLSAELINFLNALPEDDN